MGAFGAPLFLVRIYKAYTYQTCNFHIYDSTLTDLAFSTKANYTLNYFFMPTSIILLYKWPFIWVYSWAARFQWFVCSSESHYFPQKIFLKTSSTWVYDFLYQFSDERFLEIQLLFTKNNLREKRFILARYTIDLLPRAKLCCTLSVSSSWGLARWGNLASPPFFCNWPWWQRDQLYWDRKRFSRHTTRTE